MGHPVHATYKPLKGRFGDRLMLTIRSRFGAEMISARRLLMRVMRYRGPARIVGDGDRPGADLVGRALLHAVHGTRHRVLHRPGGDCARPASCRCSTSRCGASPAATTACGSCQIAAAGEELAPGALIERYAAEVESLTRERPPDWLWNYRRWKVQRDAEGNPHVVKSGSSSADRSDIRNIGNTYGYLAFLNVSDTMRRK